MRAADERFPACDPAGGSGMIAAESIYVCIRYD